MFRMNQKSREDGFTVAELVIASAILFFALTAILGLVGASQRMSVTAKRQTLVTNAVAFYVDRWRAADYGAIGIQGVDPGGAVPAVDNFTYQGYPVTVENRVVSYKDSTGITFRKELNFTITITVAGRDYSSSALVAIRNPNNTRASTALNDPNAPKIKFDDLSMPGFDNVVFGNEWYEEQAPARIKTITTSPNDKVIKVQYRVGDQYLRDAPGTVGNEANFEIAPPAQNVTVSNFIWDSRQEGITDGFQTIIAIAEDDQQRTSSIERRFIIDNIAPGAPGVPVGSASTSRRGQMSWGAALDPPTVPSGALNTYGYIYLYQLYAERAGAGTPPTGWALESTSTVVAGNTAAQAITNPGPIAPPSIALEPFSRYWARVFAGGPRQVFGPPTGANSVFISKPEIRTTSPYQSTCLTTLKSTGSASTLFNKYALNLYISKPTFPYDPASLTYQYQYKLNSAGSTWSTFTPTGVTNVDQTGPNTRITTALQFNGDGTARAYWFRVAAFVRPTGYQGGTLVGPLYSTPVGVSATTNNATVNLLPDWSQQ